MYLKFNFYKFQKYKYVTVDESDWENLHSQQEDSESDAEDWENSMGSSELNYELNTDESDEADDDTVNEVLSKASKFFN